MIKKPSSQVYAVLSSLPKTGVSHLEAKHTDNVVAIFADPTKAHKYRDELEENGFDEYGPDAKDSRVFFVVDQIELK